ncbi:MAG: 3-dehydroquinate synthase [Sedimentisphaerales bacterium]|nr:3-dehydroquinate synthase [Sedimentisphaerales bacterium]
MHRSDPKFQGRIVHVNLGRRSYPIYIGSHILPDFGPFFTQNCPSKHAIVVTDDNVKPIYAEMLLNSLAEQNLESHLVSVPPGESSKQMAVLEHLYDKMFDFAAERSDCVIALGGGVIGDLAGFLAATFKRGLNFVQVPTSLLAMVDSSIGGKTGINHPRGKNMIGSFYQPKMVFADTDTLKTLPPRELGCGLAETVKHAIIRDAGFFATLEQNTQAVTTLQKNTLIDLVERNCQIKAAVVSADEHEAGLRGILNLGHTVGHAIETTLKNLDFHHGEAVSLGIVAALRLALSRKLLDERSAQKILLLLQKLQLPTHIQGPINSADLYQAMLQDKKVKHGKINFVLPTGIGSCDFINDLSEPEILTAVDSLTQPAT